MGIYDKLSELEEKTKKKKGVASSPRPQSKPKIKSKLLQPPPSSSAGSREITVQLIKDYPQSEKKERKETIKQSSNIAILQLTNKDIEELKENAFQAQTYRLSEREIEWIKDTAYVLSKEIKRGKVSQIDILRLSFKLFKNLFETNKSGLIEILEKTK